MKGRWLRGAILSLAAGLSALFVGCFPGGPRFSPDPQPAVSAEEAKVGGLRLFITDQTTDGRVVKIRGKILNPYKERIDGVRMIYLDIAVGEEFRVLGQSQKLIDETIDGGGSRLFRWDIESMYSGTAGARFQLLAFAIKRGDQTLPLPLGWEEGDDESARGSE